MDKKNKITFGLKNLHYAVIEEEGEAVVYDTPKKITGAANFSLKKNSETTHISADDEEEYASVTENKGYEGDLEIYGDIDEFLVDCMGMKNDGNTIVENKNDTPKHFALLCEFDGDVHKKRHVFYRCLGKNPDIESGTRGDKIDVKTIKLSVTSTPAKDTGDIKRTVKQDESDVYKNWFTEVQTKGATTNATEQTEANE